MSNPSLEKSEPKDSSKDETHTTTSNQNEITEQSEDNFPINVDGSTTKYNTISNEELQDPEVADKYIYISYTDATGRERTIAVEKDKGVEERLAKLGIYCVCDECKQLQQAETTKDK